jgi:hypothetical protein
MIHCGRTSTVPNDERVIPKEEHVAPSFEPVAQKIQHSRAAGTPRPAMGPTELDVADPPITLLTNWNPDAKKR